MMKAKKIDQNIFSNLKNQNLIDFILKCCEVNEKKRLKVEDFEAFDFWKVN